MNKRIRKYASIILARTSFLTWLSILSSELLQMFSHFSYTVASLFMSGKTNLNSIKCFCSNIVPFLKQFIAMSIFPCKS